MVKAFKYRIYPNKSQEILLSKTFGCVRLIWNANVASFNSHDKEDNPKPNIIQKSDLILDRPWLSEVSVAAIQQKVMDFKETLKQHFSKNRGKKIGRPSFKKKGNTQSYRLPNRKFGIEGDRIGIEKTGWVGMVADRDIPDNGKILSCPISKNPANQYFVSITVDCEISKKPETGKEAGIDSGIKEFATLSDGIVIDNPKYLRENQSGISRIQRHMSRKIKGGSRWHKNRLGIAGLHNKVSDKRLWFLHNPTTYLVDNHDATCVEDLNVSGMLKSHGSANSISDAGFSLFRSLLEYKCEWHGKTLSVTDRFHPSSKTCGRCGRKKNDLTLSDGTFVCDSCGLILDRDLNAALNIKRVGVDILYNRTPGDEVTSPCEASIIK